MTTTMTTSTLSPIPDSLRPYAGQPCLVFPASRPLDDAEAADLITTLDRFLAGWSSHGEPVDGAGAVLDNRFIVVTHRPREIGGCSRDALLFFLRDAGERLGVTWTGGSRIFWRDADGNVRDADRPAFRALAAAGDITPDTIVYDTIAPTIDTVLQGRFALPARDSWHAKLMPAAPAANG